MAYGDPRLPPGYVDGNYYQPQWQATVQPVITTSGTTIINTGGTNAVSPLWTPAPEPGPLEWLRKEVDEVCELGRAA